MNTPCPEWENVSAAIDGELSQPDQADAFAHARSCSSCRQLLSMDAQAGLLARPVAFGPATWPLDEDSLTGAERRWLGDRWRRWLLTVVAVAIVLLALPGYVDHGTTGDHVSRHLATWQIAFGVGLAIAAAFTRFSYALLAMSASFTVLTVISKTIDLFAGHDGAWADPVHLVELIGAGMLWFVIPPHLKPRRPTLRRTRRDDTSHPSQHRPRGLSVVPRHEQEGRR